MDLLSRRAWSTLLALSLATACVPEVDVDESRLAAPRLLAVCAEPAEAAPGQAVTLTALYAGAEGPITEAPLSWALCNARRPLAELGPVSRACLELTEGDWLAPLGEGVSVTGTLSMDACRLFGPDPPPAEPGVPPGRPVDPDSTGGYRQPIQVAAPGDEPRVSLFELRLVCGIAGATQAQAAELTRRYRRNVPVSIDTFEVDDGSGPQPLSDAPVELRAGSEVTLRVAWPECPDTDRCGDGVCGVDEDREGCAEDCDVASPARCGGAERYIRFDPETRSLRIEREAVRIAWYASGGSLAEERTGVASDDYATASVDTLVLDEPSDEPLHVIVVARDSRGAASWAHGRIRVIP